MIPPEPLFSASHSPFLLGRPTRSIPTERGLQQLTGGRILVTGAGGSLGRALIARLAPLKPEGIIALDHHEASLFRLGRDLPDGSIDLRLGDVRNGEKLHRLFLDTRPTVVFHFAAYKHVPLAEYGPDEFVSVNLLGTQAVVTAATAAGVGHLVYPSSDKAVNPPSAYGATKRLAETLLLAHAADRPIPSVHIVRYANILGSSGSASETLAHQARAGLPLTLTDERMTRYWMTMDEAVDLLWHSLGLPSGSRTLLDTGEPIPVKTMAQRIHALLSGDEQGARFAVTGIRPGERLFEELHSANESLVRCGQDPVLAVVPSHAEEQYALIPSALEELRSLLAAGDVTRLHQRLMELAGLLQ